MVEIIGVKFSNTGKTYYFDPAGLTAAAGEHVLVETARGVEMGKVVIANKMVAEEEIIPPLKPIIRIATQADFKQAEENKRKEKEAFTLAVEKISEHKLDMKLVDAEYTFDRSKILFYFTADGRVDFRELVKSLAGIFRTRIELRQIGVRDEARQLGSYGICGRFLCCSSFLNDFHPVSIKMAKEQGLSLNPTKISGVCGRLMCCLQYEQNVYDDMLRKMPRKGEKVSTQNGVGVVTDTATLKGQVRVKFTDENGEIEKFETYKLGEFQPLSKKGKSNHPDVDKKRVSEAESKSETEVETEPQTECQPISDTTAAEPQKNKDGEHGERKSRRRHRRRPGKRSEDRENAKAGKEGTPTKTQEKKNQSNSVGGGYSNGYEL